MKPIAIFIVAGHSKDSPWASSDWLDERELNKKIAIYLSNKLELQSDIDIITVWVFSNLPLGDKIDMVNKICKDEWYTLDNSLLVSIHVNAGGWTWIEGFSYNDYVEWKDYCKVIVDNVVDTTWLKNRGAKYERLSAHDSLWIVHNTIPLACLIENGFIDTDADRKVLTEDIEAFSDWIYNWLKEYIWFEEDSLDDIITECEKKDERIKLLEEALIQLSNDYNELEEDMEKIRIISNQY